MIRSAQEIIAGIFGNSADSVGASLAKESSDADRLRQAKLPRIAQTRIFVVANQKGGVGKTTTTVNLAAAFSDYGANVLVIDMDPQGNASTALGIPHKQGTPSTYDVIEGRIKIADAIQRCPDYPTLDVVPSTIDLSGAELEISTLENRTNLLKEAVRSYLEETDKHYDYVLIDCAPSLGLLVLNSFSAATEVIIPIQAEYYALEGLGQLLNTIKLVQHSINPGLHVSTMLVTMFDKRTLLSQEVYEEVKNHYPEALLETVIPRAVKISEAPSFGKTIIAYDNRSSGSNAYRQAALEIATKGAEAEAAKAKAAKSDDEQNK